MRKNLKIGIMGLAISSAMFLSSCDIIGTYPMGKGYGVDTPFSHPRGAIMEGDGARINIVDEQGWRFAARDMVSEFNNNTSVKGVKLSLEQKDEISDHASMIFDNYLREALIDSGYKLAIDNESDYKIVYSARLVDEDVKTDETYIDLTMSLFIDDNQINEILGRYQIDIEEANKSHFTGSSFLPSDKRIKEIIPSYERQ